LKDNISLTSLELNNSKISSDILSIIKKKMEENIIRKELHQQQIIEEKTILILSLLKSKIRPPYVIIDYFEEFMERVKYPLILIDTNNNNNNNNNNNKKKRN
jgi:hypothetical protein